jgi:hypothetical protein
MNVVRFALKIRLFTLAILALTCAAPSRALAQGAHTHKTAAADASGALLDIVRQSTERFKDVNVAKNEGYALQFGCVSGGDTGAMGMHFVNMSLVGDSEIDPTRPEIVIYEPMPDGSLKLIGADYLVVADAWNGNPSHKAPPQLMGQLLHYFEAPNRFGLPAFYTLHVWAWKTNPTGAFVNWHSNVSCNAFSGQ